MQYLIRHKENKMYYANKVDNTHNHFVEDKENAYIFKNKWEANRKLKELGNNFEVIKKMIDNLLNDGYYVCVLSDEDYQKYKQKLNKQIVGKSKYENASIVEYLPNGKEFYVVSDEETSYDCTFEWDFRIVTTYKGIAFMIIDSGSN